MIRRDFVGIIPSRWASSRYPGKPLCNINGHPMIARVYQQAVKWDKFDVVYVATDDQRIARVCGNYQIPCLMTSNEHKDCLDRAYEAAMILLKRGRMFETYIVIQGDEPLFNVETLDVKYDNPCINFYTKSKTDIDDPNVVKVVIDKCNRALYFSRHSIPYNRPGIRPKTPVFKQIGVYAFNGGMLRRYNRLGSSVLETAEGVGLNRMLENGMDVMMKYTKHDSTSVDTPEDRDKVIRILKGESK
ncbi:3-deoxy-manno-octulosonate cytidylyltransferase [Candidatus Pacearchaeota archaeon]|nr:3-deoxy-manno-octulosonate cytidylyltransferase [Candidatus Pacearchaeota archaeon]